MKICSKCKIEKEYDQYHKKTSSRDGYAGYCKRCNSLYAKQWNTYNKDKKKNNRVKWDLENKESLYIHKKEYKKNNKDRFALLKKQRKDKDIIYKIKCKLRSRLACAIKRGTKNGSAVKDLGCSMSDFKQYIESLFQSNMTWDNYGLHGWHIDHIKPLSSFDLSDPIQFKQACHYTNLQPLWAIDNLKKSNKV